MKLRRLRRLHRPKRLVGEFLEQRIAPAFDPSLIQQFDWHGLTVDVVGGEWIAQFDGYDTTRAGIVDKQQLQADLGGISTDVVALDHLGGVNAVLLQTPTTWGYSQILNAVEGISGFRSLIPNFVIHTLSHSAATIPDDPRYTEQWDMDNTGQSSGTPDADIDAPEAWDITTGSSSIVVGVIDTGVNYLHPDLAANMWTNPGEIPNDNIDNDNNGFVDDYYGFDFINNDSDPMDDGGHGTHVAGTIGAVGDNGFGVVGVNWDVSIMALKFLGTDGGSTADAIEAINYATMMKTTKGINIKLTNNSWGGGPFEAALFAAIQANEQAGMLFVAAAGNDSTNNDLIPHFPSNYDLPNIISVASTNHNDVLSSFSNFGATTVDIAAPGGDSPASTTGGDILSTWWPGASFESIQGTSMASPHVAGVAALVWASCPTATYQAVRDAIYAGADPLPSLSGLVATGARLNAFGALTNIVAPPSLDLQSASDSGASDQDNVTNPILSPNGDIRMDVSESFLPATIDIYRKDPLLGDVLVGTIVNMPTSPQTFTFTAGILQEGENILFARATAACGTSKDSTDLTITIDTVAPVVTVTPDLIRCADTGTFNYDNTTTDRTPTFLGSAEPGSAVNLFASPPPSTLIGTQILGHSQTNYSITSSVLTPGTYTITATAEDLAGNVSTESPSLTFTLAAASLPAGIDPVLIIPDIFGSWPKDTFLDDWMIKAPAGLNPANLQITPFQSSYTNLLDSFTAAGFDLGTTLFFGAWDWRLSLGLVDKKVFGLGDGKPDITASDIASGNLNSGVEYFAYWMDQIDKLGFGQVDVVAFGSGALIARDFIESGFHNPATLKIDDLVFAGAPHRGYTDAYNAINRPGLLDVDDPWYLTRDLAVMAGRALSQFAPSILDVQPQYVVAGILPANSYLTRLNSPTLLAALNTAVTAHGVTVTNLIGTGTPTPQNPSPLAISTDGDGEVLAKLSQLFNFPGVVNVTVKNSSQLIDIAPVGFTHDSLSTEFQNEIFAALPLQNPSCGFPEDARDDLAVVGNTVFHAVAIGQSVVPANAYSVIEDGLDEVLTMSLARSADSYISVWLQPDTAGFPSVSLRDPNGNSIGAIGTLVGATEFSTIPTGVQFANDSGRFILIPTPDTGTYFLVVVHTGLFTASMVNGDTTGSEGVTADASNPPAGVVGANISAIVSLELTGQTTFARLSGTQPLSFIDVDGDVVNLRLSGTGFADVQLRHTANNADVTDLIDLHGATASTSLSVSVSKRNGGNGRVDLGTIQALTESGLPQNFGGIAVTGSVQFVTVSGRLGSLTATAGLASGGAINVGANAIGASSAGSITLGSIGDAATLNFNGLDLGSLTLTHGAGSGTLTADDIGSINITAGSFNLDVTATGRLGAFNLTGGNVGSIISVDDGVGGFNLRPTLFRATAIPMGGGFYGQLFSDDDVGSLTAQRLNSAIVSIAGHLSRFGVNADVTNSQIAPLSVGSASIGTHFTNSVLLAGANLGADGILGGVGLNTDSFGAGFIASLRIGGNVSSGGIAPSLITAGLDPIDAIYKNGNDTILGGKTSSIKSFSIAGTATADSYFAAGLFPKTVSINGVSIDPLVDSRFLVG